MSQEGPTTPGPAVYTPPLPAPAQTGPTADQLAQSIQTAREALHTARADLANFDLSQSDDKLLVFAVMAMLKRQCDEINGCFNEMIDVVFDPDGPTPTPVVSKG
ncbi:MAG TPA: hypothetical protein VGG12_06560 [Methylovirgula sp.]|jgi:hypothetical protein